MKGKYIKIEVIDPNFDERIDPFSFGYEAKIRPRLSEFDCPNIIKKSKSKPGVLVSDCIVNCINKNENIIYFSVE